MSASDPWERRVAGEDARYGGQGRLAGLIQRGLALWLALALVSAIVFSQGAMYIGVDANWDLLNYHLYNPFAVVEGRFAIDHNPAGIQTYINPTLDLLLTYPPYALGMPQFATRLIGAIQGLNFVLILAIVLTLKGSLGTSDHRLHILFAAVAAILGMTGALTISEIGTSFGDLTTAVAVLLGVFLALRSVSEQDGSSDSRLVAAAGLLLGVAAGLKLTNAVYLVALGTGLTLLNGRIWLKTATAFGLAAMVGLTAAHGWWSWFLWQETGNPVFPFFNTLFHSPYYPDTSFSDARFFPKNWLQTMAYPFWFSRTGQTAEVNFHDFRFPIAYVLTAGLTMKLAFQRLSGDRSMPWDAAHRRLTVFTAFLVIAYVLWQGMFSIQRYAIAMEVLLPAFIIVALSVLLRRFGWAVFAAAAVVLVVTTHAPNWGRLRGDRANAPLVSAEVHAAFAPLLDDAAVIFDEPPLGYVATAFPKARTTWVGTILSPQDLERAKRQIALRGKRFTLRHPTAGNEIVLVKKLEQLGLPSAMPADSDCRKLPTVFESLLLCRVGLDPKEGAGQAPPSLPLEGPSPPGN